MLKCGSENQMGQKSGRKRKKDKNSPSSQSDRENKRTMANWNGMPTSPTQGMTQTQTGYSPNLMPATFTYTPNMYTNGPNMANMNNMGHMSMNQPSSPNMQNGPDQGVMGLILQRLDKMDKKLGQLETIQNSISTLTVKVSDIEVKVKNLEQKVATLENSRDFDSESVQNLNTKQKEIDSLLLKMKNIETEQSKKESDLKAQVLDIQCRSMRDNLIFFGIPEEKGETDEDCVRKILSFIEEQLDMEAASIHIKLHRAHRMGRFNPTKVRPIVAKFAYYPDRERVRKSAGKLKNTSYGISQQFPKEIMDKRRKLVPIMKDARAKGKDAYIAVDKLYINGVLYREPGSHD